MGLGDWAIFLEDWLYPSGKKTFPGPISATLQKENHIGSAVSGMIRQLIKIKLILIYLFFGRRANGLALSLD